MMYLLKWVVFRAIMEYTKLYSTNADLRILFHHNQILLFQIFSTLLQPFVNAYIYAKMILYLKTLELS